MKLLLLYSTLSGPQGPFSRLLPARPLCTSFHPPCRQLVPSEGCRVGRGDSGHGSGFLWLPVAQSGLQHGPYPPVWLLSAARTLRLALNRYAGPSDSLPRPVVSVLLPDRVPVCRECLRSCGRRGPQPSVTRGTEDPNNLFCSSSFSRCYRRTLQMASKRVAVSQLLGFNTSYPQVSSGCNCLM